MSKVFGEIRQLAFVVKDIDAAMEYWAACLGIGPFFIKRHIQFSHFRYRGKPAISPTISIALANSGFIQIELIQQHDDIPSIYLESTEGNLQHVAAWMTTAELLAKRSDLLSKGYKIAQEGIIPSSGVRLVYLDTETPFAHFIFEIADLMEPSQYHRILGIKSAFDHWDGHRVAIEVEA